MSPFAAPKPPKPTKPHATLELLAEVDAVPDDDDFVYAHGAPAPGLFDADATTPPVDGASPSPPDSLGALPAGVPGPRARRRSLIVGVVAALVGLSAMALAFQPWHWTHAGTRNVSAAHSPVAVTLAKRSPPPVPRAKMVATAKKMKPVAATTHQAPKGAKPAAAAVKPAALDAKTRAAQKAAPVKPGAAHKPTAAPAKPAPAHPTTKI